jgi:uncharacterized delta-60 repeat protein
MRARAVRVLLVAAVGAAAWCVGVGAAVGAPGDLDATFGTGGIVTTDFALLSASNDYGQAVVVDSDDRIIVAGSSDYPGDWCDDCLTDQVFAVARYTSAGALDTSFGHGGKVTTVIHADGARYRSDFANAGAVFSTPAPASGASSFPLYV